MELMTNTKYDPRPSPIAGSWYPDDPTQLRHNIARYLGYPKQDSQNKKVFGLIAPHAGYFYSGPVAGSAFSQVSGLSPQVVVVFSPCHQFHPASILTSGHSHYQTPLGDIPVAHGLLKKVDEDLRNQKKGGLTFVRMDQEHSLEIELPFLQCTLSSDFALLPIMVREHDLGNLEALAESIYQVLDGHQWLMVASTDLSHFYDLSVAKQLDDRMLAAWRSFSTEKVLNTAQKREGEACGLGAVLTGITLCKMAGAKSLRIVGQDTSATASGDTHRVVGYGAAVITD